MITKRQIAAAGIGAMALAALAGHSTAGAQGNGAGAAVIDVDDHGHDFRPYGSCTPSASIDAERASVTWTGRDGCAAVAMGWQAWERFEGRAFEDQDYVAGEIAVVEPGRSVTVRLALPCGSWRQLDSVAVRDGRTQPGIAEHSQGAYQSGVTVRTAACAAAPAVPVAPPTTTAPVEPSTPTTAAPAVPAAPVAPVEPATPTTAAPAPPVELVTQAVERSAPAPQLPQTGAGHAFLAGLGGFLLAAGAGAVALARRLA